MQLKITANCILIACLVTTLKGKALRPKGCFECEEEVWEEVPCEDIPSNSTTVSTPYYSSTPVYKPTTPSPKPTTPTSKPTTVKYTKPYVTTTPTPSTAASYPTTVNPDYTTPKDPYKKCYCECKMGCKEFCRKVVINAPDEQIVQVSKISIPSEKGRIESTHFLQRELIPKTDSQYEKPDEYPPSYDDEPDNDKYPTPPSLPQPPVPHYEDINSIDPAIFAPYPKKSKVSQTHYYTKPIDPLIEPIYHEPYAIAEAGANNHHAFASYPPNPTHTSYFSPPRSGAYDFPVPFENVFSRVSKSILDPVESIQISLDSSSRKAAKPIYTKCPSYSSASYSSPTPVKNSQLETSVDSDLNFDDSFDEIIKEFMSNNPSNEIPQSKYSKPFYSVSYSR